MHFQLRCLPCLGQEAERGGEGSFLDVIGPVLTSGMGISWDPLMMEMQMVLRIQERTSLGKKGRLLSAPKTSLTRTPPNSPIYGCSMTRLQLDVTHAAPAGAERSLEGRVQITNVATGSMSQVKGSPLSWSHLCARLGGLVYDWAPASISLTGASAPLRLETYLIWSPSLGP